MNGDVTVRQVMAREFVGVSEADTLGDTARLMLEEDVDAVVVLRGQSPVGLATQQDVLEAAVGDGDLSEQPVSSVMREDPATVDPDATLAAVTDEMSAASERHLLVEDRAEVLGLVSEHDVVTASTFSPGVDGEGAAEREREAMVAETAQGADEATSTTADDGYSNQGICEVCGTLTRDLSTFNGQLVCNDCKDV